MAARPIDPAPGQSAWTERRQDLAAVAWPSFLAASAATMIVFALVDPLLLVDATPVDRAISRLTGYSIGFFFLWLMTAVSSLMTLYLVRTRHRGRELS